VGRKLKMERKMKKQILTVIASLSLGLVLSGIAQAAQVIFSILVLRDGQPTTAVGKVELSDGQVQDYSVSGDTVPAQVEFEVGVGTITYRISAQHPGGALCMGERNGGFIVNHPSDTVHISETVELQCE
jgi:hypothetical protein